MTKSIRFLWILSTTSILYALPFSIMISNGLLLLQLTLSLVYWFSSESKKVDIKKIGLACSIFLISMAGLVYSNNPKNAFSILETRLPIFLIPISFGLVASEFIVRSFLLRHYLFSLIFTFFVLLTLAVYRNILDPGPETWFNKWYYQYIDFTYPIGVDPLYIGLFVAFGILIAFHLMFDVHQNVFSKKCAAVSVVVVLLLFLVMIGVRSLILITGFLIILYFVGMGPKVKSQAKILALLLLLGLASLSFLLPVTRERFEGMFKRNYTFTEYTIDRFYIWSVALDHVWKNRNTYLIGTGLGTSEQTMDRAYEAEQIEWDFENKTNTHNQYISFLLDMGVMGILLMLAFFYFCGRAFVKSNDHIGIYFIVLLAFGLVVENFFDRQKGAVFIGYFTSLLLFSSGKNSEKVNRTTAKISTVH